MGEKYVGHINCQKCGYQNIRDPRAVTIWLAADAARQLCEVICPGCNEIRASRIEIDDFIAFRTHGVQIKPLSDKFEPLTEEMITQWDPQKEFASDGFKKLV